ncbi:hypothetical protein BGZ94_008697 [Podila epigama]|nr:hypothetical protein BGZ94_008697 [Podila epigama]
MATSVSSTPKESTLLKETEVQDRSRSEMLVTKSATSEPQLKMPHTTTKTKSVDDILEIISATKSITSKMPLARSASTKAGTSGGGPPTSPTMLSSPNPPSQTCLEQESVVQLILHVSGIRKLHEWLQIQQTSRHQA